MRYAWLGAAALVASSLGTAEAASLWALTDDGKLAYVEGEKPAVMKTVTVSGVAGKLIGIDRRPADGKVYGVSDASTIYAINPETGAATMVSQLSAKFESSQGVIDFNPVADRLRMISPSGVNYRVVIETGAVTVDGELKYDATDTNAGKKPMVVAGAYTNAMNGAKETALYNIDAAQGVLVLQAPPNDSVLKTKGLLGVTLGAKVAFDIAADGKGGNWGWLVSGTALHSVDLATGKAAKIADIAGLTGTVIDIIAVPVM